MRKILLVCAALACMTVSPVPAQDAAVKKIIEMGQNDNQVMHQLDILTNRFGGRLIGSDAYENAAEWMVREFKSWGLDVQLEEAGTVPVGFNRGPWFGRLLSDNGMILHFATPTFTECLFGRTAEWPEGAGYAAWQKAKLPRFRLGVPDGTELAEEIDKLLDGSPSQTR